MGHLSSKRQKMYIYNKNKEKGPFFNDPWFPHVKGILFVALPSTI